MDKNYEPIVIKLEKQINFKPKNKTLDKPFNEEELNIKITKLKRKTFFKYNFSRFFFVILNVIAIFIAASIVILNLYAIRFNKYPEDTMLFFVLIAVLSVVTTLIVSIQSFLGITNKKAKLHDNVVNIQEVISDISTKNSLTVEDYDNIAKLIE
ncbi:hypothetical protein [Mycoplasma seminis]|uniref:DUF4231 domain-containing protein n=1 Tax=Mycoplasma seminis TaxID=512749 RepID=A0ABY9HB23_9MOLU|nr:hypothetical protein [Mycoplasma seminis]WLP85792.1 hypothetical protein Q8852_01440 [Mycoplasma seminis]